MLHTVCVELGKINLSGNSLTIYVPSIINYETLKKPQNYADLVDTLQKLGYNLNIEFVLDETAKTEQQDKVSRLSKILGFEIETI